MTKHRGSKEFLVESAKIAAGCRACLGAHRSHTCGKKVVKPAKLTPNDCPACRGRHRAHKCRKT